jgi:hypothetical protein
VAIHRIVHNNQNIEKITSELEYSQKKSKEEKNTFDHNSYHNNQIKENMEDPMTFKKETMQNFNQKFSNPFYGESLTDSEKFKSENQTSNGFVNA